MQQLAKFSIKLIYRPANMQNVGSYKKVAQKQCTVGVVKRENPSGLVLLTSKLAWPLRCQRNKFLK